MKILTEQYWTIFHFLRINTFTWRAAKPPKHLFHRSLGLVTLTQGVWVFLGEVICDCSAANSGMSVQGVCVCVCVWMCVCVCFLETSRSILSTADAQTAGGREEGRGVCACVCVCVCKQLAEEVGHVLHHTGHWGRMSGRVFGGWSDDVIDTNSQQSQPSNVKCWSTEGALDSTRRRPWRTPWGSHRRSCICVSVLERLWDVWLHARTSVTFCREIILKE